MLPNPTPCQESTERGEAVGSASLCCGRMMAHTQRKRSKAKPQLYAETGRLERRLLAPCVLLHQHCDTETTLPAFK